jgi:ribosomal protein S18 acetylase RimI-like enzyme
MISAEARWCAQGGTWPMIQLTPDQVPAIRDRFVPDQPGPLVGLHLLQTGNGTCFVDTWPNPRAVLVDCARNYSLTGDPEALQPNDLKDRVSGFLDTSERFLPLLRAAFPDMIVWDRVIFALETPPRYTLPPGHPVRRLTPADTDHLHYLSEEVIWVGKTWGGPSALAASGTAWGAFAEGRLVSVACTFFVGDRYEDIGIATEPEFRGLGLGGACAGAVCTAIQARGRRPSWSTSTDNAASIRVAEKLGFELQRRDHLYVIGIPVPEPSHRPAA